MSGLNARIGSKWAKVAPQFMPFADAASAELPLARLLRLALFQFSVGMVLVLLNGTLNRVMIVELGVPSWLVALMISLPIVFAPFRALIGFRSDQHRSALGWKRVPYIWLGSLMQFGGLAIMPFALIVLSGDTYRPLPSICGQASAAIAFLLVGAGLHTTQTAGLALANDLAPAETRPRVVALLYVMLLVGMVVSALVFGAALSNFSQVRLIQVIQGAAVATFFFNMIALWQQEPRRPNLFEDFEDKPRFSQAWAHFAKGGSTARLLVAVGLGTAGFSMQDILLEPYGGQVLHLGVGATTALTAIMALGTLAGFAYAARALGRGEDSHRLAAMGALVGVFAFAAVVFADPLESINLFRLGVVLIGFGGGLFSVGTLTAAMERASTDISGLALGAWGAVQATAAGLAIAMSGALRDFVAGLAMSGQLGEALATVSTGYGFVYHLEIGLLFATLVAIGPLVRHARRDNPASTPNFGLAEFPS